MTAPDFEVLDWAETPLGTLVLQRRPILGRPGATVTEVTLDHQHLMSSLNARSEEALAELALAWHEGPVRRILIGGLGLGHTAHAALKDPDVERVRVIEYLPRVIEWLDKGLTPLAATLSADPRLEVVAADAYGHLLAPPTSTWDLILLDIDHSPDEPLGPASASFHSPSGLQLVAPHLAPGGILGVWSAEPSPAFASALEAVFHHTRSDPIPWENELWGEGERVEDWVFLARRPRRMPGDSP